MLTSSSGKCWYFPQKRLPRFLKHVRLHFCQWQGGLWKIFYNFSQNWENVNSLGDDWLCEVQKLLEINFLVDVTVKVEISTSGNTISRIFLKCHTLKLILKNINKQASLMRPRRALNMKVANNANAKIMPMQGTAKSNLTCLQVGSPVSSCHSARLQ